MPLFPMANLLQDVFQSPSPPRRGCADGSIVDDRNAYLKFQSPSPPRRGCASQATCPRLQAKDVSIPIPSEKGMRPYSGRWGNGDCPGFNPHPLREGDAPPRCSAPAPLPRSFNPHPLREGDAPSVARAGASSVTVFQSPSPPRRGCAVMHAGLTSFRKGGFQSPSPPRRGCAQERGHNHQRHRHVSIPIPSEKGMRPGAPEAGA